MITVSALSKRYGDFVAVDAIDFTCRAGRVTGFLGPNGAGKTTTMRVMVGLTPASGGEVRIGGHRYVDLPNPARYVGVLLDASAQHDGRTGREVLVLSARVLDLPLSRVDEMLELVGLSPEEARRRVRNYSLGMRQRLGIANALIGDPQVLILDEPANGLDPAGIRWMRDLLKDFADRGGTVLLSSHLLFEVEQIADDMVLIGHGRILAQGDKQTLLSSTHAGTLVSTVDTPRLAAALTSAGLAVRPSGTGLSVEASPLQVGTVAAQHSLVLTDLRPDGGGLEHLFLELTSDTQRERPSEPTSQGAPA